MCQSNKQKIQKNKKNQKINTNHIIIINNKNIQIIHFKNIYLFSFHFFILKLIDAVVVAVVVVDDTNHPKSSNQFSLF